MILKNMLQSVLYEEEDKKVNTLKTKSFKLKLFYNFSIFMKKEVGEKTSDEDQESVETSKQKIAFNKNGLELVSVNRAMNIQSAEELVDYVDDIKLIDLKISSNLNPVVEIVKAILSNPFDKDVIELLEKDDKLIIDIDYGEDKDSSVGFKINKVKGVDSFSVMMKKNGAILPNQYQKEVIDRQLLFYRNRAAEEKE